jgi:hypothetical protein
MWLSAGYLLSISVACILSGPVALHVAAGLYSLSSRSFLTSNLPSQTLESLCASLIAYQMFGFPILIQ